MTSCFQFVLLRRTLPSTICFVAFQAHNNINKSLAMTSNLGIDIASVRPALWGEAGGQALLTRGGDHRPPLDRFLQWILFCGNQNSRFEVQLVMGKQRVDIDTTWSGTAALHFIRTNSNYCVYSRNAFHAAVRVRGNATAICIAFMAERQYFLY